MMKELGGREGENEGSKDRVGKSTMLASAASLEEKNVCVYIYVEDKSTNVENKRAPIRFSNFAPPFAKFNNLAKRIYQFSVFFVYFTNFLKSFICI